MSKSRGNVINPDEMVKRFGADALRCYLLFMGPYDSTMPWSTKGMVGIYRFLEKVWRVGVETIEAQSAKLKTQNHNLKVKSEEEGDAIEKAINRTIKKVGEDIDSLKFNTAISAMMEFVNEAMRGGGYSSSEQREREVPDERVNSSRLSDSNNIKRGINVETLRKFLAVLSPLAPFITEELWQKVGGSGGGEALESVHSQAWPLVDEKMLADETVTIVVQVNGKTRDRLQIANGESQEGIEEVAKGSPNVAKHLERRKVRNVIFVPGRLINFVVE
jgi:leucyl-tRNA synthetase